MSRRRAGSENERDDAPRVVTPGRHDPEHVSGVTFKKLGSSEAKRHTNYSNVIFGLVLTWQVASAVSKIVFIV